MYSAISEAIWVRRQSQCELDMKDEVLTNVNNWWEPFLFKTFEENFPKNKRALIQNSLLFKV